MTSFRIDRTLALHYLADWATGVYGVKFQLVDDDIYLHGDDAQITQAILQLSE